MFYIPVKIKLFLSIFISFLWGLLSLYLSQAWIIDLSIIFGSFLAYFMILGIAIIPGMINAFILSSLLFDKRPSVKSSLNHISEYPAITILIAAFNEEVNIKGTIESILKQFYPGEIKIIVISDGSIDKTTDIIEDFEKEFNLPDHDWIQIINNPYNRGKASALNDALWFVKTDLVITIDADCYLYRDALVNIVSRYLSDPKGTVAVAGAVLVRNSRESLPAKAQEWDYFLGIATVKRTQSLYQGTLVAQGAFSLYETKVLFDNGGWQDTVGEDIVLTWDLLEKGYRIGFAENACLFTTAPNTWKQFIKQRQRWSRGLIEAFKRSWRLLFKPRLNLPFIWANVFFPYLDLVYTIVFIPGVILAFFGIFWIAGPLTLAVLPLAILINYFMFRTQVKMFRQQGLKVRKNFIGFIIYSLFYATILQPACVVGYINEILNRTKTWGTK